MLVTRNLAHLGSCLTDTFDVESLALNLTQFYTEATKFHLSVDTAQILYLTVIIPTAEVACMVHTHRTSPSVLLYERAIDKRLGCTFRQPPVTATHLHTGKAQFAGHALRYKVA